MQKAGTNKNYSIYIIDSSGSMAYSQQSIQSAINEKIESLTDADILSIFTFNGINVNHNVDKAIKDSIKSFKYSPTGMTNLNDAIGTVINKIDSYLAKIEDAFKPAIDIVIMTDGLENASKEYTLTDINNMKAKAEAAGWTFTFIGADIDAFSAGSQYGFTYNNTLQFSKYKVRDTMSTLSTRSQAMYNSKLDNNYTTANEVYIANQFTDAERSNVI